MEHPRSRHALAALVLLSAIALVYGRVAGFGYSGIDDSVYVSNNAAVRAGLTPEGVVWAFTSLQPFWLPLTWISLMLDVSLFGLDPGAQHLVNVAIHGANSLLVYALALALLRHWLASLLIAFLFAIHPLHVESVAWITERKDVLSGFFFLLSVLAYLWYAARPSAGRYGAVVCGFVLALLAKPMAVTLPAVLLLLDYWPLRRLSVEPSLRWSGRFPRWVDVGLEKTPLFALSLACGLVTLVAGQNSLVQTEVAPIGFRIANAVTSYSTYLFQTIAPTGMAVIYPMHSIHLWRELVPSLLVLGVVSAAAVRWREPAPWLLFGWLWFVLTLLPVIGLIQSGAQSHADRFMYLPLLGPCLMLGAPITRLGAAARARAMLALAPVLAAYSFAAWVQVGYWSSTETLAEHALEVVGDNVPLHSMLVGFYLDEGRLDDAEAHAMKVMKLASGSPLLEELAYSGLGLVMLHKGQYSLAERMFRSALEKSPRSARTLNNLGIALEKQGRREEAAKYFAEAWEVQPNLRQARENLNRVSE